MQKRKYADRIPFEEACDLAGKSPDKNWIPCEYYAAFPTPYQFLCYFHKESLESFVVCARSGAWEAQGGRLGWMFYAAPVSDRPEGDATWDVVVMIESKEVRPMVLAKEEEMENLLSGYSLTSYIRSPKEAAAEALHKFGRELKLALLSQDEKRWIFGILHQGETLGWVQVTQ